MATRLVLCYVVVVAVATAALVWAMSIKPDALEPNVRVSVHQLQELGRRPQVCGIPLWRIDTFTDMLMLNVAMSADADHPVTAAMECRFFIDPSYDVYATTQVLIGDTDVAVDASGQPLDDVHFQSYGRYWHGLQTLLRPLLVIAPYSTLLVANGILLAVLIAVALTLMWRRCGRSVCVPTMVVLMAVMVPVVPLCLQLEVCFALMSAGMIAVLTGGVSWQRWTVVFFLIGALTAYADLLTTPQLTLCIPLIAAFTRRDVRGSVAGVIGMSASWAIGYVAFWLTKLPLAYWLAGVSLRDDFVANARVRSSIGLSRLFELMSERAGWTIDNGQWGIWLLVVVAISVVAAQIVNRKSSNCQINWLLVVAAIIPCWYMLMLQHSIIHYWFTWRALAATALALWINKNVKCKM